MRFLGNRRSVVAIVGALVLALVVTAGATAGVSSRIVRLHFRSDHNGKVSAARARAVRRAINRHVIVIMRNQFRARPASVRSVRARVRAESAYRAPVVGGLRRSGARVTRQYRTLNAFAATVSINQRASLRANARVASVIPDAVVRLPRANDNSRGFASGSSTLPTPSPQTGICPADPAKPLLEPEALQTTHTAFTDPSTPQAQNLARGAGVKVAFFADGLDINNPDLLRADGSRVITDYRDFSGDGPNAPTGAAEAFGDASSIAAQGRQVYDLADFVNPLHPLPKGCNITVRGMAPGASLVAMKVFGNANAAFNSTILQGLDWAVAVDHADVLSESFGGTPLPDSTNDLTRRFNEQAVAAGATVVESTGDGGVEQGVNSAASDPAVIAAGANTNFRGYAQTVSYGFQFSAGGFLSNNISSIETAGIDQGGHNLDLVAPGEVGWALCSPNVAIFEECVDFKGAGTGLQQFGGTSESAPLIAGASALVIQSYRATHGGATPSPALVKQILTGTANDLGFPSDEEGAGQLDSLKAVQAARSINGGTPTGHGLVLGEGDTQLDLAAPAGTNVSRDVAVTNAGAVPQIVRAQGRAITRTIRDDTQTVNLANTPRFIDQFGSARPFTKTTFTVPAGTDRLVAFDAWPGPNARVGLALIDSQGNYAAYTRPQGNGNHGEVDVERPAAGTWTAIVFLRDGTFTGPVHLEFASQRFGQVDTVTPSARSLAPGQTGHFRVQVRMPQNPGDSAHDLVLSDSSGDQSVVPVVLRSLVRLDGNGGRFAGTLVGGNGRGGNNSEGQVDTFAFDVPRGMPILSVGVTFRDDDNTQLLGQLVDPGGNALGFTTTTRVNPDNTLQPTHSLQTFRLNPRPGRWHFVIDVTNPVGGNALSAPYNGTISFRPPRVRTNGIPDNRRTVLPAGQPTTASIEVTNSGVATEDFFADARLGNQVIHQLAPLVNPTTSLPLSPTTTPPLFIMPSQSNATLGLAQANRPVAFDFGFGDPDIASSPAGPNAAQAVFAAPELSQGVWFLAPTAVGPFNAPVAKGGRVTGFMFAQTREFDGTAAPATGDAFAEAVGLDDGGFNPVTIDPGARGRINVTFTPTGARGTRVSGTIFVDTWSFFLGFGDEVAAIPYSYTVG